MKDFTVSKKIDGKYVTMISVKDGWKFSFHPAFKRELKSWLNGNEDYWNANLKEWDVATTPAQTQPAPEEDVGSDSIPF